ncbi:6319_t:CDS:1, partial [Rhizophagus irregularis]
MYLNYLFLLSVLLMTAVVGPFLVNADTSISSAHVLNLDKRHPTENSFERIIIERRKYRTSSDYPVRNRDGGRKDQKRDIIERGYRTSSDYPVRNRDGGRKDQKRDIIERGYRTSSDYPV